MSQRTKAVQVRQHNYYMTHKADWIARRAAFKLAHPEEFGAMQKAYYRRNKVAFATRSRKNLYECTKEQYNALLKAQFNQCAICSKETTLCVDHNHETKKIRGLLCRTCNIGLGCFGDRIELLKEAVVYIRGGLYAVPI